MTGATSGNGLAIIEQAVAKGAAVVAVARNKQALDELQGRLESAGARIATCVADVSELEAVERVAAVAEERFGGFDSWINNAAVGTHGTLEQVSVADHRRMFDVNYFGVLHGSLVAARHLRRRGGGAIINVGSILGDRAIVQQGPYCATKQALQALTDTLRMELERDGADISVTLVKPGAIDTPFPEHARNYMGTPSRLPQPLYTPEVVADAVLFACANPRRLSMRVAAASCPRSCRNSRRGSATFSWRRSVRACSRAPVVANRPARTTSTSRGQTRYEAASGCMPDVRASRVRPRKCRNRFLRSRSSALAPRW